MKSTSPLLLTALLVAYSGCGLLGVGNQEKPFALLFEDGFDHDRVIAELDGEVDLDDTLVSNMFSGPTPGVSWVCCGPAEVVRLELPKREHQLIVSVGQQVRDTIAFDSGGLLSIGINYHRDEKRLIFEPRTGITIYE